MMATECFLCLEVNKGLVNCIKINSSQWKEQCIESVIEKHLWPMATLKSNSSWLCLTCWTFIHEFHQFYRRIENANLYYKGLVKAEIETEIEDPTLIPENVIIPETVLTEDAVHNSDIDETYENSDHLLESEKTIAEDDFATKCEGIGSSNTKSVDYYCQINKNVNDRNPLEVSTTEDSQTCEIIKANQILQSNTCAEEYNEQHLENVFDVPIYDSGDSIADSCNSETAKTKSQIKFPEKTNREDYNEFLAKHYTFSCIICQKSCNSFPMLRQHFAAVHKREAYVICCGKKIKTRRCLVDHIHTHFAADQKSISIQPEEFNCDDTEDNISQSYKDHHDENPIEVVEETSANEIGIGKDLQTYQLENCAEHYDTFIAKHFQISCSICQHSSKTFSKLRQHFAEKHKQEETFVFCCGRKIKRPRCLFEHIHSHLNPDYFKCKYCPKVLKDRRNYLKHMLRHEGKLAQTQEQNQPEGGHLTNVYTINDANYNNILVHEFQSSSDHSHDSLIIPDLKNVSESILMKSECINFKDSTNGDNSMLASCTYESDNANSIKESQKQDTDINPIDVVETYQVGTDPEEDQDEFLAKHIQLTCPICQEPCKNFIKLRHHFAAKHNKQQPYILCCGRKHKRRRCLVEHIKSHLNPDYFKCKYCAKVLKERRHFLHHVATHEGTAFRCGICDRKFANKYVFESHKTTHSRREFSCSECGKSYDKRYQLTRHERAIHRGKTFSPDKAQEKNEMIDETELNITSIDVKPELVIEADNIAEGGNMKMHPDQSKEIPDNCSQHSSDHSTEVESEKSNATESEDMERYLPSHAIKPGDYDDFLAKHIKFTCSVCQESYKNFTLLRQHFADVHKRVGYVLCCGTKHKTRSFLVDHIHTHLNPEYFKCEECSKVFKERRGLTLHIAWHKGKIYRCKICKRKFLDKIKYKSHKSTHASNKRQQFPCPECGKAFGNKALLSYHQKAMHLNMFVKLCDICGVTFRGSECFKSHMEKHKGGVVHTFPCDICGRILSGKQTLKLHKMSIHPEGGVLPYSCHICKKTEATRSRLNTHIRKSHATSYDHKCTICERAFKQRKSLRAHMVVHTGEPLFKCTWCSKTFNSSGNLSSHRQRVHPSEYKEWKRQDYLGDLPPKLKLKTNL